MDFNFSDEQNALREQLLRFVQKEYGFEQRRSIVQSAAGHSAAAWKQFADMGLLGLTLPESHGGLGGNAFDTLVVMEMFGRGLVVEPYLSSVVLGAGVLMQAGNDAQQTLLERVAGGELKLALACEEAGARHALNRVSTRASSSGQGWLLDGAKTAVLHGAGADQMIVSARTSGSERDEAGISLFLVDGKAAGVRINDYPTLDGQRVAEIEFQQVRLGGDAMIGAAGTGWGLLERALQRANAALCAEAVGAMLALIEITGAYLKTRKQFGVPIGSFQVLQHRMADMLMAAEQARSMAYLAAAKIDSADGDERRRVIAAAKFLVAEKARFVGQQAVQLHGGIGVTDELNVSHYFKRLTMIGIQFGDADHHLARFGEWLAA